MNTRPGRQSLLTAISRGEFLRISSISSQTWRLPLGCGHEQRLCIWLCPNTISHEEATTPCSSSGGFPRETEAWFTRESLIYSPFLLAYASRPSISQKPKREAHVGLSAFCLICLGVSHTTTTCLGAFGKKSIYLTTTTKSNKQYQILRRAPGPSRGPLCRESEAACEAPLLISEAWKSS